MEEEPTGVKPQLHLRDAMRDRLVSAERPAELPAALGELHDLLELAVHHADVLSEQARSLPVHRAAEDRRSAALGTQSIGFGHSAVIEAHLADRCAGQPDI